MLINMMAEDGAATAVITQRTRRYRNRVKSGLKECLKRASRKGELSAVDIDEHADLLLGLVLGFNIAARGGASAVELKALLNAVQRQVSSWRRG